MFAVLKPIVILPKLAPEDQGAVVASEAMLARKIMFGQSAQKPGLWRPKRVNSVGEVLNDAGLIERRREEPQSYGAGYVGVSRKLSNIGGEIAFVDEKSETDLVQRLNARLADDYHVVPDFDVSLNESAEAPQPAELTRQFGTRHRESGVGRARHRSHQVRGRGVICAVLDTGVDADHKELQSTARSQSPLKFGYFSAGAPPPRQLRGFDPDGHGTHVAGVIGGRRGVAPDATLVTAGFAKTPQRETQMYVLSFALDWLFGVFGEADSREIPVILNLSIGVPYDVDAAPAAQALFQQRLDSFRALIELAVASGVLVVAAIGNDGRNAFRFPAGERGVLSVGSVDNTLRVSPFSGSIPGKLARDLGYAGPRLVGFGEDVVSARPRNWAGDSLYERRSGTSQAAAYVSGLAALYWSQNPHMTAQNVFDVMIASALDLSPHNNRDQKKRTGAGLARWTAEALLN